jgi:hypothetical protein
MTQDNEWQFVTHKKVYPAGSKKLLRNRTKLMLLAANAMVPSLRESPPPSELSNLSQERKNLLVSRTITPLVSYSDAARNRWLVKKCPSLVSFLCFFKKKLGHLERTASLWSWSCKSGHKNARL